MFMKHYNQGVKMNEVTTTNLQNTCKNCNKSEQAEYDYGDNTATKTYCKQSCMNVGNGTNYPCHSNNK